MADKGFNAAKQGLTFAQGGMDSAVDALGDAKKWLQEKKGDFNDAKQHVTDAIKALEKAKKPFKDAQAALRRAHDNVNNLCSLRDCKWRKPWNCVWNLGCHALRGVAHLGLAVVSATCECRWMIA